MTETTHEGSPKKSKRRLRATLPIILAIGLLIGFAVSTAIRFALIKDTAVHYHANFALFINGQQDEFKSFTYYEEVASCTDPSASNPKVRVHMHDNKAGLVHVHAGGVTWGQFFENLGYTLGDEVIATSKDVFTDGTDENKLTFVLNGEPTNDIANKVIDSEDKLLINYGKDDQSTLQERYSKVDNTAGEANRTNDPAACAGAHEISTWDKLKQAVGLSAAVSSSNKGGHSH